MSKLETNTIDTLSGTANLTIGGANNTGTTTIKTNDTTAITIDSNQNVGIGETNPDDALLVIKGNSDENTTPSIRLKDGSDTREAWITNNSGDLILSAGGDDNVPHTQLRMLNGNLMTFRTADTERARISSSGDLQVATTVTNNYAQTSGDGSFQFAADTGTTRGSVIVSNNADNGWSLMYANKFNYSSGDDRRYINFYKNGSGLASIQLNSAGTQIEYNTTSDRRLKENIVDIDDGITRIKQLQPRKYNWIGTDFNAEGFIADEADGIVPEVVSGEANAVDEDGNPVYQQIEYSKFVPLLTAALKEAIAKIETLETQRADLEARVTALENA